MSKFVKSLVLFVAGLQLLPSKASNTSLKTAGAASDDDVKATSLQPLNSRFDNLFAGHASHSSHRSHASHASHYSGSGGSSSSYVPPVVATPAPARPVQVTAPVPDSTDTTPTTRSPSPSTFTNTSFDASRNQFPSSALNPTTAGPEISMSRSEKLHLQVVRVQIRLNSLGLYNGKISGDFDPATRGALKLFQKIKSLPETGLMTTPTLNALAIPAVK